MHTNEIGLSQPVEERRQYGIALLILITAVALILRLYKLGEWSYWVDEVLTVTRAQDGMHYLLTAPKVSGILIQLSVGLFGVSEWSTRLAPALLGVLALPAIYIITRRLFDQTTGLLSAAFLAVSMWHIYLSQNARYYSALFLFVLIALYYFYLSLETSQKRYVVLFVVFSVLAVSERLFALLIVTVFLSYLAVRFWLNYRAAQGLDLRRLLLIAAIPILAYIAFELYQVLVLGRESHIVTFVDRFVGVTNTKPQWVLKQFLLENVGAPVVWAAAAGMFYTWRGAREAEGQRNARLLFILCALIPLLAIMAVSVIARAFSRYLLIALPGWIVLAAVGIQELHSRARRGDRLSWAWIVVLVGLIVVSPVTIDIWYYMSNPMPILSMATVALFGTLALSGVVQFSSKLSIEQPSIKVSRLPGWLSAAAAWQTIVLLLILLFTVVQLGFYFQYQHGYRDEMRALLYTYEQDRDTEDVLVIHQTMRPIVRHYLGDEVAEAAITSPEEAVADGSRAWVIEEFGMSGQIVDGASFAEWSDARCSLVAKRDHFAAGKLWPARIHVCASP